MKILGFICFSITILCASSNEHELENLQRKIAMYRGEIITRKDDWIPDIEGNIKEGENRICALLSRVTLEDRILGNPRTDVTLVVPSEPLQSEALRALKAQNIALGRILQNLQQKEQEEKLAAAEEAKRAQEEQRAKEKVEKERAKQEAIRAAREELKKAAAIEAERLAAAREAKRIQAEQRAKEKAEKEAVRLAAEKVKQAQEAQRAKEKAEKEEAKLAAEKAKRAQEIAQASSVKKMTASQKEDALLKAFAEEAKKPRAETRREKESRLIEEAKRKREEAKEKAKKAQASQSLPITTSAASSAIPHSFSSEKQALLTFIHMDDASAKMLGADPKLCCMEYLKKFPNDDAVWYRLGIILFRHKETILFNQKTYGPKECIEQALTLNPTDPTMWNDLGIMLMGGYVACIQGHNYTDIFCHLKAIELNPEHYHAWSNLGSCLNEGQKIMIGDTEYNQKQCYERSLTINSHSYSVWHSLGNTLKSKERAIVKGRRYTAEQCFAECLRLNPQYVSEMPELNKVQQFAPRQDQVCLDDDETGNTDREMPLQPLKLMTFEEVANHRNDPLVCDQIKLAAQFLSRRPRFQGGAAAAATVSEEEDPYEEDDDQQGAIENYDLFVHQLLSDLPNFQKGLVEEKNPAPEDHSPEFTDTYDLFIHKFLYELGKPQEATATAAFAAPTFIGNNNPQTTTAVVFAPPSVIKDESTEN